ncbi:MAG: hypothetical protein GC152_09235 [Alphaproteobacteria bacterium]|nr:hypothetical protein [Alphaproteobacteria bacterium]
MLFAVLRIGVALFGLVLVLVGIPLTPSPIPLGLILIAIGFSLIVWASPGAVRWLRRRWRWFDRQMAKLASVLPEFLAQYIRRSDLDEDMENGPDDENGDEDGNERRMIAEARRRRGIT